MDVNFCEGVDIGQLSEHKLLMPKQLELKFEHELQHFS
jgi:hypothetical protein